MNSINLYRSMFEKFLVKKPSKYYIWILYIYIETNNGYINHAKKILFRSLACIKIKKNLFAKLYYFDKIFFSSYIISIPVNNWLNIIVFKKYIFNNFNLFWVFEKIILYIYFIKNKHKNYFKYKELLKFFDFEIKSGKIQNSIILFEKLFFKKKENFSVKLILNLSKRMINLLNHFGKLAVLKNLLVILDKIKNIIYMFKFRKKLIKNKMLKFYLLINKYETKDFRFFSNFNISLIRKFFRYKIYPKKYLFYNSILKIINKNLVEKFINENYFKIFKNSIYFLFSIQTYSINLNILLKSLVIFINIIFLDQPFLIYSIFRFDVFLNRFNKYYFGNNFFNFFKKNLAKN
jgi:hypothetical protein